MYLLPYETTICRLYPKLDTIKNAVRRAALELPLPPVKTPAGSVVNDTGFITPRVEHDEDVPTFTQYLNIGDNTDFKLIIDGRQYMKYDTRTGEYRLVAQNDWSYQCIRMALNVKLLKEGSVFFSRLTDIPAKVFTRWVSGALINKYILPPEAQQAVSVICAYYYFAMLNDELENPSDERVRMIPTIARITSVPAEFISDMVDQLGVLSNIEDLAHNLSEHGRTLRLNNLKWRDIFILLSPSWFGVNSRENIGIALEHLPTFIAMVYMALADRSYRKTIITQRAESVARGNELSSFINLVNNAVATQVKE